MIIVTLEGLGFGSGLTILALDCIVDHGSMDPLSRHFAPKVRRSNSIFGHEASHQLLEVLCMFPLLSGLFVATKISPFFVAIREEGLQ